MFTVTVNAALAFDIFVAMSAMFSFYKIANFADKHGRVSPCFQYFMRLFRLVPLYYFVFLFGWMLVQFMGSGPLWSRYEMNFNQCNDYWWSVLLFVSNFFPAYRLNNEGCFFWSWAICCDMQFFMLIPPIVWFWRKWPKSTIAFLALLALTNIGVYIYLFITSIDMKAGIMAPQNQFLLMDIVSKPYTKGASFVLGIYMGMFLYYVKEYEKLPQYAKPQRSPIVHKLHQSKNDTLWFVGYQLSLGMILFLILIPYKANSQYWIWPQWCNSLYLSLSRPFFIIAVFFPFVAIYLGRLKTFKGIFGAESFTPIGRLTFAMYLIHPLIICLLYITVDQSQYLRLLAVVGYFVSFVLLSLLVAALAFLAVEAPISHQFRGVLGVWCSRRPMKKD